jgi:WD40 repeat protein
MNRNILLIILILPFMVLASSCSRSIPLIDATTEPPTSYSVAFESIDPTNVSDLTKVRDIPPESNSGLVGALTVSPSMDVLFAVYVGDSYLRRWDIESGKLLSAVHLGVVTAEGLQFDRAGEIVIGATEHEIRDDGIGMREYISDIVIWDTDDGRRVRCFYGPCDRSPDLNLSPRDTGIAMDGLGRRDIQYSDQTYSMNEFDSNWDSIYHRMRVSADEGPEPGIGRMVFDQSGDWFASASRRGRLVITTFVSKSFEPAVVMRLGNTEIDVPVQDLEFSFDNRWIAGIWGETLAVWDLSSREKDPYIGIQATGVRRLAFDRTSGLLFVGGEAGVQVWNLSEKVVVSVLPSQEVTALLVSPDNRLLLVGDISGLIQIWAVE